MADFLCLADRLFEINKLIIFFILIVTKAIFTLRLNIFQFRIIIFILVGLSNSFTLKSQYFGRNKPGYDIFEYNRKLWRSDEGREKDIWRSVLFPNSDFAIHLVWKSSQVLDIFFASPTHRSVILPLPFLINRGCAVCQDIEFLCGRSPALYAGLPFEVTGDIYLPQPAVGILKNSQKVSQEQIEYL